ncbi:MAG: PepSY domain-containing protein [Pseudomonadota bacterium]
MKVWMWLHKWSSLICTVFMLMLALTGFPLIFSHEINHLLGHEAEPVELPADTPRLSADRIMAIAIARYPDKGGMFISQESDDDRVWYVTLSNTPTSEVDLKQVAVDARTGEVLVEPRLSGGVMNTIESLHVDMLMGLPGMIFLGLMGVLLVVSLISGAVLYAPFMRKLGFAQVRVHKGRKTRWLDAHNALGIVTLMWFMVVGSTGIINAWGELLVENWQRTNLAEMVSPYKNEPTPTSLGSLQTAIDAALAIEPARKVQFVAFPGTTFSSPYHYGVFLRGTTPITERMSRPVLVDSRTAMVTANQQLPWYLNLLQVSRPLHFGDYAGLPLKLLWAVLNLLTLIVLISGLYLWWLKHRSTKTSTALERAS